MTDNATPRGSTSQPAVTCPDSDARRLLAKWFCTTIALVVIVIVIHRRLEAHMALRTLCFLVISYGVIRQFNLLTHSDALPGLRSWYARDPGRGDQFIRWGFVAPVMLILGFFFVTGLWASSSVGSYVFMFWMVFGTDLVCRFVSPTWLRKRVDYRKRRVRRWLVAALCAALLLPLVGFPVFDILQPEPEKWKTVLTTILLIILVFLGMPGMSAMTRFLHEERMTGREADERQIAVRDRAYRIAYRLLGATLVFLCVTLFLSSLFRLQMPHLGFVGSLWALMVAFIFVLVLPNAMILWIEEDLLDEADEATPSSSG